MEMVPNCNIAHQARSSHVNMLCTIDKDRLCEFHLNALASVTLGHCERFHVYDCVGDCLIEHTSLLVNE